MKHSEHPADGHDTQQPRLTPKQRLFIEEYLIDLNATKAAIRAGYSVHKARSIGHENLTKPDIAAEITRRKADRMQRLEISQDDVLRAMFNIARANPSELVRYVRRCCRYCYGMGHAYQWTPAELVRAQARHTEKQAKNKDLSDLDASGGTDYDPRRPPREDCPECHGRGETGVEIVPNAEHTPGAKALYAGIKEGKDGTEVKLNDQMAAWANIARHVGFYEKDNEQQQPAALDTEALRQKYARTMEFVMERHAKMLEERKDMRG